MLDRISKEKCEYFKGMIDIGKHNVDVVDTNADIQTILKGAWHSTTDELPSSDEFEYLGVLNGKFGNITFVNATCVVTYCDDEKVFRYRDDYIIGQDEMKNVTIDYWAELPTIDF